MVSTLLWAVLKGGDSATVKSAGLPNVTGYGVAQMSGGSSIWGTSGGGAFFMGDDRHEVPSLQPIEGSTIQRYGTGSFTFDASRVNSIYGASTTVQPAAIQLLPQIKF